MAHTLCPNEHSMWNGGDNITFYIYPIEYFRNFTAKHPDVVLFDGEYVDGHYESFYFEDCYDSEEENKYEDFDCWRCDECGGLVFFHDNKNGNTEKYDYVLIDTPINDSVDSLKNWEDYRALIAHDSYVFEEASFGRTPIEALESYDFDYLYKISPDKTLIYAIDKNNKTTFGYKRVYLRNLN